MIRNLFTCAVFLLSSAFACQVIPPAREPPDEPLIDPPPIYAGVEAGGPCGSACAALGRLHCPEAAATDAGESCAALCNRIEGSGLDLHSSCVGRAADVAAVRACGVRCAP